MMIGKPTEPLSVQSVARTPGASARRVEPGVASDAKVEGIGATDNVKLSDAGRALTAGGRTADEVRADKVAAVKKAVEEGTYRVQATVVADRLISDAAEMLRAMKPSR